METLAVSLLKASLLLALGQALVRALPRLSAATRHLILIAGMAGFLAIPIVDGLLPEWSVTVALPAETIAAPSTVRADTGPVTIAAPAAATSPRLAPGVIAAMLWIVVAAALAVRLLLSTLQLRGIGHRGTAVSPRLRSLLHECRARLGVLAPIHVLRTDRVRVPMVWGIRSGTLLVPDAAESWSDEHLRATFLHELGHLRRLDYLSLGMMNLVAVLLWFHPQIWMARRRALIEAERACDDLVLRNGQRASAYAAHLLRIAGVMRRRDVPGAALAMSRPSQLEGRMQSILSTTVNRQGIGGNMLVIALAAFLAAVVPLAALQLTPAAPAPPPAPAAPRAVAPKAVPRPVTAVPAAAPVAAEAPETPTAPAPPAGADEVTAPASEAPAAPPAPAAPVAVPQVAPVPAVPVTPAVPGIAPAGVTPVPAVAPAAPVLPATPGRVPAAPPTPTAAPVAAPRPAALPLAPPEARPFRVIDEVKGRTCTMRLRRPVNTGDPTANPAEQLALQRLLANAKAKGGDAVTNVRCYREISIGPACPAAVECEGEAIVYQEAL